MMKTPLVDQLSTKFVNQLFTEFARMILSVGTLSPGLVNQLFTELGKLDDEDSFCGPIVHQIHEPIVH